QHTRKIVAADDWWLVRDTLRGPDTETEPCISRLHFHPDIAVTIDESGTIRASHRSVADDDPPLLSVHPLGTNDVRTTTTEYFPEFGVAQERQTAELRVGPKSGTTALGYLLAPSGSDGNRYDSSIESEE
ncbi:hypothetical protein EXE41_18665, partial [Halorubrum sp. SD690R]